MGFLDPSLVVLMEAFCFDVRVCFSDTVEGRRIRVVLFTSVSRLSMAHDAVSERIACQTDKDERAMLRKAGKQQGFWPVFAYVSTGSTWGLDQVLQDVAQAGETDIVVSVEEGLTTFLRAFGIRPSLAALPAP